MLQTHIPARHPENELSALEQESAEDRLELSAQDLVKDNGQLYFINYLNLQEERPSAACAQAVFVLAVICDGHLRGQLLCAQAGLLGTLLRLLAAPGNGPLQGQRDLHAPGAGLLVKWLCLCLGKLSQDMPEVGDSHAAHAP